MNFTKLNFKFHFSFVNASRHCWKRCASLYPFEYLIGIFLIWCVQCFSFLLFRSKSELLTLGTWWCFQLFGIIELSDQQVVVELIYNRSRNQEFQLLSCQPNLKNKWRWTYVRIAIHVAILNLNVIYKLRYVWRVRYMYD